MIHYRYWSGGDVVIAITSDRAALLASRVRHFVEIFNSEVDIAQVESLWLKASFLVSITRSDPSENLPYSEGFQEYPAPIDSDPDDDSEDLDLQRAIISSKGVCWLYTDHAGHHWETETTPLMSLAELDAIASK